MKEHIMTIDHLSANIVIKRLHNIVRFKSMLESMISKSHTNVRLMAARKHLAKCPI